MRIFIGIEFGEELKTRIADLQSDFRKFSIKGKWKYIDNFHLTLKFLGEVEKSKITDITDRLVEVCANKTQFDLNLKEVGYFSGNDSLRVLWLGLGGDIDKLKYLQKEVDNSLNILGFVKEKRTYKPHITIGQDIILNEKYSFNSLKETFDENAFPKIRVEKISIIKSEQMGSKRIYSSLRDIDLK